ncbi:DNA ligase [Clostridia bacterium]|nr:DNA ligase [Clostridia bacterium]
MASEESEILKLREEIKRHNHLYYVLDTPQITDNQYDSLMRRLKDLEAKHPEMQDTLSPSMVVGGVATSKMEKIKHQIQMNSLQDVFDLESVLDFCNKVRERFDDEVSFVVEPKIDGLSVSLEYENGILVRAATRGDGFVGEDVTKNAKMLESVPQKLKHNVEKLTVRGEVFMPNHVFEQLTATQAQNNETCFKNARNAAAGSLRQKDPQVTRERQLDIFVFNLQVAAGFETRSHKESIEFLNGLGFKTIDVCGPFEKDKLIIEQIEKIKLEDGKKDFNIDGAVVKVDNLEYRKILGKTAKFPKWAVAFKYTPQEMQTEVLDIEISVGRTGVLTPVAVLKPVLVSGSVVSRAILHNQDFIKKKMINIGSVVLVRKAGDIIPEIASVLENPSGEYFKIPRVCPSCGMEPFEEEVELSCQNPSCPEQMLRKLTHFVSRDAMNIEGLGPSILKKLIEGGLLSSVADIYYLTLENLVGLERLAERSAQNILQAIEKSKTVGAGRLLFGLGIKQIGAKAAHDIIEHFGDMEQLFEVTFDEIVKIHGLGGVVAASLVNYFSLPPARTCINRLKLAGVRVEEEPKERGALDGINCVVTGSFEAAGRQELEMKLKELGARISESVSKRTDYLLVGSKPGKKLEKAKALGVKIVFENDLGSLFGNLKS